MKPSIKHILTAIFVAATLALVEDAEALSRSQGPPPRTPSPSTSPTAATTSSTANSTPTASPTPSAPSTAASPAEGIRGYRRFHANDSHIGRPIPCTYEEKLCFRHNVLYNPPQGRCLPNPFDTCTFVANRTAFSNGSGHLFAMCLGYEEDPCIWNDGYRMAYDGRCYRRQMVRDVLCGCPAEPTPHFLGGVECRCSAAAPVHVEQPAEDGRCRVPDLRFPDNKRSFLGDDPIPMTPSKLNCSRQQSACFAGGKVKVRGVRGCFSIGERGPCTSDHVVALDIRAALSSRAEAMCVHVRGGCPEGEKRLAFDGQCHRDRDIHVLTYDHGYFSEFGRYRLTYVHVELTLLSGPVGLNGSGPECLFHRRMHAERGQRHYPKPPCGESDRGRCDLYEVQVDPPDPLLDDE